MLSDKKMQTPERHGMRYASRPESKHFISYKSPERPRRESTTIDTVQLQTLIWATLRIIIQALQPPITPLQARVIESTDGESAARVIELRALLSCSSLALGLCTAPVVRRVILPARSR